MDGERPAADRVTRSPRTATCGSCSARRSCCTRSSVWRRSRSCVACSAAGPRAATTVAFPMGRRRLRPAFPRTARERRRSRAAVLRRGVLYAVFGGADFGTGTWDLTAGTDARARHQDRRIRSTDSIGPVWEANHVWLIFVPGGAVDRVPGGVRRDDAHAGAAVAGGPGALRHRAARLPASCSASTRGTSVRWARVYGVAFSTSPASSRRSSWAPSRAPSPRRCAATGPRRRRGIWVDPTTILGGPRCWRPSSRRCPPHRAPRRVMRRRGRFRRCALGATAVVGVVAPAGIGVLRTDSPTMLPPG